MDAGFFHAHKVNVTASPIRFAITGLGRAGWDIHAAQLRRRQDAVITAVCDRQPDRRAEAQAAIGCQVYDDYRTMLARADADVVVIATPSAMHAADAVAALESGRHVVIEKPMATSVDDVDRVATAAARAGRTIFPHHNHRFGFLFEALRDTLASGRIGRLFHVQYRLTMFGRRADWQTLAAQGGGLLNNTGSHMLDLVLQFLDAPVVNAMGDMQQIASLGDVEDHIVTLLRAENGRTAMVEISTAISDPVGTPRWRLCGSCGTIASDGKTVTTRWFDPTELKPLEVDPGPAAGRRYNQNVDIPWRQDEQALPTDERADFRRFYDNLAATLAGREKPRVTVDQVRELIRVQSLIRAGTAFDRR